MTELRDEIVREIMRFDVPPGARGLTSGETADRILSIPRIKEALAFHESCQQCFAVNGEFVVTEANVKGAGGVSAS